METNTNLYVIIVDRKKQPEGQGCGYFYLVRRGGAAHTAFRTKAGLKRFMCVRGLKVGKRNGVGFGVAGQYLNHCEMISNDEFEAKYNHLPAIEKLDNGDFTKAFVEGSEQGPIIHYLNCNSNRVVYDYFKTAEIHF